MYNTCVQETVYIHRESDTERKSQRITIENHLFSKKNQRLLPRLFYSRINTTSA